MYATLSSMIKHRLEGIIVQFYSPSHLHPPPFCIALPMQTFPQIPPTHTHTSLVTPNAPSTLHSPTQSHPPPKNGKLSK